MCCTPNRRVEEDDPEMCSDAGVCLQRRHRYSFFCLCIFASVDAIRHITALRRSKVQPASSQTSSFFPDVSEKLKNSARASVYSDQRLAYRIALFGVQ